MTGRKAFGFAALAYTAFAVALTRGLAGHYSTAVLHDLGDPLLSTWILWWNAHHLPFTTTWWDGLSFFPEHGSLAFSDHRVGLGLVAGPLQWLGGTPVLAYNVTFLSCFVFSALAAHALTWTLTRSHAAGFVSGLIFGFNPFRISHIAHLELQAAYWLPLAFVALHFYVRRFDTRWLIAFAALLTLQGLSSGYYLFYALPVVGLWILWFARDASWRRLAAMVAATAVPFVVLLPVLLQYQAIQQRMGLARTFGEMEDLSADLTGILSANPLMMLWRVPSLATVSENEVYLGIVAPLLVLAALLWRVRAKDAATAARAARWRTARMAAGGIGGVFALVATSTLFGAWAITVGPIAITAGRTEKPLAVAVGLFLVVGFTSPVILDVIRRRSTFAFYTLAALMTWLFSLGPRPRFLGHPLLYRGPYSFLMVLPGFDYGLRAPARFIMMTTLAMAVAAGIALVRLTANRSRSIRMTVTALVLAGIALDSWTRPIPVFAAPSALPDAATAGASVLELPLGNVYLDIAATYRSVFHAHPVVNGYSGYDPRHYHVLRVGLNRFDDSILTALTEHGSLVVSVDRSQDLDGMWLRFAQGHAGATPLASNGAVSLFLLPRTAAPQVPGGDALPVAAVRAAHGALLLKTVTDGDPVSRWVTPARQGVDDEVLIELDAAHAVTAVELGIGPYTEDFPRELSIETSADGVRWEERWRGDGGGTALRAVLADTTRPVLRYPVGGPPAKFIRLRQLAVEALYHWSIGELTVRGVR